MSYPLIFYFWFLFPAALTSFQQRSWARYFVLTVSSKCFLVVVQFSHTCGDWTPPLLPVKRDYLCSSHIPSAFPVTLPSLISVLCVCLQSLHRVFLKLLSIMLGSHTTWWHFNQLLWMTCRSAFSDTVPEPMEWLPLQNHACYKMQCCI